MQGLPSGVHKVLEHMQELAIRRASELRGDEDNVQGVVHKERVQVRLPVRLGDFGREEGQVGEEGGEEQGDESRGVISFGLYI